MKKIVFVFAFCVFALCGSLKAQTSNVLYSSSRIPQINALNPAFFPQDSRFYIALPGTNINFASPLTYNSIFQYDAETEQTNVNLNSLLDTLCNNGDIDLNANIYIAGLGLRLHNTYITASAQAKTTFHLGIPKGLLTFLTEGNYPYAGEKLNLIDGNFLNAQAYTEYAVGAAHQIGKLTVGARFKLLNGYMDLRTTGTELSLYTAEDLSSIQASLATRVHYSLPFSGIDPADPFNFNPANLQYFPGNWGFGLDLGAKYEFSMFEASLSILDIGKGIHWTDNIFEIAPANNEAGVFEFSGLDISSFITNGAIDTAMLGNLRDSLMTLTDFQTTEGTDYWTSVPTKFNAGIMAHLTNTIHAGLLFHGELDHNISTIDEFSNTIRDSRFRSNTTLLANINLYNWVELMASCSVVNDGLKTSWFNPGFGVNVSLFRSFQFYMMVDYISNLRLVEAKQFSLIGGINIIINDHK